MFVFYFLNDKKNTSQIYLKIQLGNDNLTIVNEKIPSLTLGIDYIYYMLKYYLDSIFCTRLYYSLLGVCSYSISHFIKANFFSE
jgi:hypothetical protein